MNWPKYYCPISARLGSQESLATLSANDEPCRLFQPIYGNENGQAAAATFNLAKRYAGAWYARDSSTIDADPDLSDACFATFPLGTKHCLMVSWQTFPDEAISAIWEELAGALMDATFTGIRKAAMPKGKVVVLLDYLPGWSFVSREAQHGNLIATLKIMHKGGYVHGGINERWLNPESPRRIFGLGMSRAYATWRESQGVNLRDLRGDPRYACAEEILGGESCADFDLRALGATLIASYGSISDDRRDLPWKRNVNGPSALLARIANRDGYKEYSKNLRELTSARRLLFAKKREVLPPAGGDGSTDVNVEHRKDVATIVDKPGPARPAETVATAAPLAPEQIKAELTPGLPIIIAMVVGLLMGGFLTISAQSLSGGDEDKATMAQFVDEVAPPLEDEADEAPAAPAPAPAPPPAPAPAPAAAAPAPPPAAPAPAPAAEAKKAAMDYTLRLTAEASSWSSEKEGLSEQLRDWLPNCQIKAKLEHRNPNPRRLGKAQVTIIQRVEKLCVDIDADCADKKENKIRWEPAAMGADDEAKGLDARITFRCVTE